MKSYTILGWKYGKYFFFFFNLFHLSDSHLIYFLHVKRTKKEEKQVSYTLLVESSTFECCTFFLYITVFIAIDPLHRYCTDEYENM